MANEGTTVMNVRGKEKLDRWKPSERLLPVNADKEAEREAGEKALWALVSLGWLWLHGAHPGRQTRRKTSSRSRRRRWRKTAIECKEEELQRKRTSATEVLGPAATFVPSQDDWGYAFFLKSHPSVCVAVNNDQGGESYKG